jgi:hypothetical protein
MKSRTEEMTWYLVAGATARFNRNKGLEAVYKQEVDRLKWWGS